MVVCRNNLLRVNMAAISFLHGSLGMNYYFRKYCLFEKVIFIFPRWKSDHYFRREASLALSALYHYKYTMFTEVAVQMNNGRDNPLLSFNILGSYLRSKANPIINMFLYVQGTKHRGGGRGIPPSLQSSTIV